jgi:hypothetical protein
MWQVGQGEAWHKHNASMLSCPTGFVLVKKVPGTLHFAARSEGHSFDHTWMNMTHVVHSFYYGTRPTVKKYYQLQVSNGVIMC